MASCGRSHDIFGNEPVYDYPWTDLLVRNGHSADWCMRMDTQAAPRSNATRHNEHQRSDVHLMLSPSPLRWTCKAEPPLSASGHHHPTCNPFRHDLRHHDRRHHLHWQLAMYTETRSCLFLEAPQLGDERGGWPEIGPMSCLKTDASKRVF